MPESRSGPELQPAWRPRCRSARRRAGTASARRPRCRRVRRLSSRVGSRRPMFASAPRCAIAARKALTTTLVDSCSNGSSVVRSSRSRRCPRRRASRQAEAPRPSGRRRRPACAPRWASTCRVWTRSKVPLGMSSARMSASITSRRPAPTPAGRRKRVSVSRATTLPAGTDLRGEPACDRAGARADLEAAPAGARDRSRRGAPRCTGRRAARASAVVGARRRPAGRGRCSARIALACGGHHDAPQVEAEGERGRGPPPAMRKSRSGIRTKPRLCVQRNGRRHVRHRMEEHEVPPRRAGLVQIRSSMSARAMPRTARGRVDGEAAHGGPRRLERRPRAVGGHDQLGRLGVAVHPDARRVVVDRSDDSPARRRRGSSSRPSVPRRRRRWRRRRLPGARPRKVGGVLGVGTAEQFADVRTRRTASPIRIVVDGCRFSLPRRTYGAPSTWFDCRRP